MALTFGVPDTELSLILQNRRAEVVDNIFRGTPFMFAMSRLGGTMTVDGGLTLVTPLRMSKNTTAGSFQNYDPLDTTPQNNETSANYTPTGMYATATLSWMEATKAQGKHAIVNLWNQKIDDAMDSLKDQFNVKLLQAQPSAGSKDPNSLTEIVDEDPTADPPRTSAIGAIGNANTWWRNKATNGGAFAVSDMNTMYNDVSDGTDNPTFLLTSQTVFEYYENSQVGQIRYGDTRIANAGFTTLQYKDAPMLWDPQIGNTDEIYFLNTKYLKLKTYTNGDFVIEDPVTPTNQAAKTSKMLWMGQMDCSNRRRVGTLHGITAPA